MKSRRLPAGRGAHFLSFSSIFSGSAVPLTTTWHGVGMRAAGAGVRGRARAACASRENLR